MKVAHLYVGLLRVLVFRYFNHYYDGLENATSRANLIDFDSTFLLLEVTEAYLEL